MTLFKHTRNSPRLPPTEEEKTAAKDRLESNGWADFPESTDGWNLALKQDWLVTFAVEELGHDAESIADELDYRTDAIERVLIFYGLVSPEDTDLSESDVAEAEQRAPWMPRPHPSEIHTAGGRADRRPSGWD